MASDAVINSRYAVVITRHRTQSGEPGASVADGVQDADTAPEPRPAEPATPSTAALRSAGGDDFCMVDEAVDHGGCYHVVTEDFAPAAEGLVLVTIKLARSYRADTSWKNRLAASGSNGM